MVKLLNQHAREFNWIVHQIERTIAIRSRGRLTGVHIPPSRPAARSDHPWAARWRDDICWRESTVGHKGRTIVKDNSLLEKPTRNPQGRLVDIVKQNFNGIQGHKSAFAHTLVNVKCRSYLTSSYVCALSYTHRMQGFTT